MQGILLVLSFWLCNLISCRKTERGPIHQGKLEIDGICGNYTIAVLNNTLDTSQVVASWTDPTTNIDYSNVFGLKDPCDFPPSIKRGDTFYFRLRSAPSSGCAQCLAYYPTPSKQLSIQVVTP